MGSLDLAAYVVNLPRRTDRRARMERVLPPGLPVVLTRTGPPFTIARVGPRRPLTTITTTDGRQLPLAASGWLIDRAEG